MIQLIQILKIIPCLLIQVAIPSSVGPLLLVICLVATIYRYRVAVFVRFNVHPFDVDECQGEDMIYDVFLICAYKDHDVGLGIVGRLEDEGFKVFYHERDCRYGQNIMESIGSAIEKSKRVVCVLTNAFLRSQNCMHEFDTAWAHCIGLNRRRLGVIKWPEVDGYLRVRRSQEQFNAEKPLENDPLLGVVKNEPNVERVNTFLSTYTYINHEREDWWQHLIYVLPTNRLG